MDCCRGIIKYVLFLFNILFWICGGVLLGLGIWLKVDPSISRIVTVAGISVYTGAIAFIVLGCVMFVVGFCGCCGAIKENKCLLGTYFTFVLVIFCVQLAFAIWAFVSQSSLESTIQKGLNNSIPIDNPNNVDAVKYLQTSFKCCGLLNGCEDWPSHNATGCSCETASAENGTCKVYNTSECTNADKSGQAMYSSDCFHAIVNFIEDNIWIIAGVALGIAVAEILLMIFALMMCSTAGKSGYEVA